MIEENARVIAVDGDQLTLLVDRQSACGQCATGSGCGASLLNAWLGRRPVTFSLPNEARARKGDWVVLGLEEREVQRGALLLYATPLAGLLGGAVAGHQFAPAFGLPQELGSILFGLSGVIAAVCWIRHRGQPSKNEPRHEVHVLRVVDPAVRSSAVPMPVPQHDKVRR